MRQLNFSEFHDRDGQDRTGQDRPTAPKITTRENMENIHEASFSLHLEGVSLDQGGSSTSLTPVLASMLSGQKLLIGYSMARNANDDLGFRMDIRGCASGSSKQEAFKRAQELWNNLELTISTCASGYHFQPVPQDDLDEVNGMWQTHIEPKAVAITRVSKSNGVTDNCNTVLMPTSYFDHGVAGSIFAALVNHKSPVRIVLLITAVELDDKQQSMLETAIKTVSSGVASRCRNGGVEETKLMDYGGRIELAYELEKWLRYPRGYRLECRIDSEREPASSFLSIVASEVFQGVPVTTRKQQLKKQGDASTQQHPVVNSLKLSNCTRFPSQIPTGFPSKDFLIRAGTPKRYITAAGRLPKHGSGLLLGHLDDGAVKHEVRLHDDERSRHCYILGATGTGKSTLLYNMISQDIETGKGVCLIDPHGDLYDQVLNSIPGHREKDVVLLDPSDFEHPVGVNFLELPEENQELHKSLIANEMMKIFASMYDLNIAGGPMFETYMRNAIMLAMEHPDGATLLDIPLIFENAKYRKFLLENCKDPYVKGFWTGQAEEAGYEASLSNLAPYITSKLNMFTNNALLRPIIGQKKSTINFRELMDEGAIVLVNLSKGVLGALDSSLLGMLLMGLFFNAALSRSALREEVRQPFYLYVDEFQNFTTDTVASLVSEARKFGLYLVLANQALTQLETGNKPMGIMDAVLGNVGTMLFFRMGVHDSQKLDAYTIPDLGANDLRHLADFHVAARMMHKNRLVDPFVFQTLPGNDKGHGSYVNANKLITASRSKYSRPASQVEKSAADRRDAFL